MLYTMPYLDMPLGKAAALGGSRRKGKVPRWLCGVLMFPSEAHNKYRLGFFWEDDGKTRV